MLLSMALKNAYVNLKKKKWPHIYNMAQFTF